MTDIDGMLFSNQFEKGGQPLTPFKNRHDEALDLAGRTAYTREQKYRDETGKMLSDEEFKDLVKFLEEQAYTDPRVQALIASRVAKNKKDALYSDDSVDVIEMLNRDARAGINRDYVTGEIGDPDDMPANAIGAKKPRSKERGSEEGYTFDATEYPFESEPGAAYPHDPVPLGLTGRAAAKAEEFKESENTDIDKLIFANQFAKSPEFVLDSYKAANAKPQDLFVAGADAFDATNVKKPSMEAAKEAFAPHLGMGKVVDASYTPTDKVIVHTRADPLKPYDKVTNDKTSMITMPGARVLQRQRDDAQTDRFFGTKIGERKPVQTPAQKPVVDEEGNTLDEDLE